MSSKISAHWKWVQLKRASNGQGSHLSFYLCQFMLISNINYKIPKDQSLFK